MKRAPNSLPVPELTPVHSGVTGPGDSLPEASTLSKPVPSEVSGNPRGVEVLTQRYLERLRRLVPADVAREDRQLVWRRTFSPQARRWIASYNQVGLRDLYLWQWCSYGIELTTLPGISPELKKEVCDSKLLSIILCVLIDDVADRHDDRQWLEVLLATIQEGAAQSEIPEQVPREHVEVTRQLWEDYLQRVSRLLRFADLADAWRFDLQQFLNSLRYGFMVNSHPALMNWTEHNMYTPHNMLITSFATLDLMCLPEFNLAETGLVRRAIWHAQAMGRIGNVLSTWRRELREGDYSAGVFAAAVNLGIITPGDLEDLQEQDLEQRIQEGGLEVALMRKWYKHRDRLQASAAKVSSIDLSGLVPAHDRFLQMYLGSTGLL